MAILFLASCKKNEYYQVNPNSPTTTTASLSLRNILISTFRANPTNPSFTDRHLTYYERANSDQNYSWNRASFGAYNTLRQIKDMDELAVASGQENYRALAKIFRAIYFSQLTETFGDVPYSDAMKALEGVQAPKYDLQKDIYKGILNELEDANAILDASKGVMDGDIIYGSKPQQALQWKKFANSFRLRLLIHLSKKEADPELNIKQQFQSIISNPDKYPLMVSNDDNAQIAFNTSAIDNAYPNFQDPSSQSSISMEKGFVDTLKIKNDPRLFSFAEPIGGMPAGVVSSYNGVDGGLGVAAQTIASTNASRMKSRYWNSQVNEPLIFLSYAEQEFLIAEAISRNWITGAGTAKQHYDNGITASMAFYGINGAAVTAYLAQPNVVFDPANALRQIATQKYISFYMNSGRESFYEQRRTGIPIFNVGPGTQNGGLVPKRWMYPQGESSENKANVDEAIKRQYNGDDNINGVMWIIQ